MQRMQNFIEAQRTEDDTTSQSASVPSPVKNNTAVMLEEAKDLFEAGALQDCIDLLKRVQLIAPSEKIQRKIDRIKSSIPTDTEDAKDIKEVEPGFSIPQELYDKLYNYQKDGLRWLWKLHVKGPGGVLADDMGLGKTVQVIAFLTGLFLAQPRKFTVIVVMPVSVLITWEAELKRWSPLLRVIIFHDGGRQTRLRHLAAIQRQGGIVLTTYGMMMSGAMDLSTNLAADPDIFRRAAPREPYPGTEFTWDYLVLDEAHKIKNPAAKTTKGVLTISSKRRILLTGTAVQNNLRELWSLYNCTHNGQLLGRMQTFKNEYEKPITRAREKDASRSERVHGQLMAQSLRKLIDPFFLRRTKAETLPPMQRTGQVSDDALNQSSSDKMAGIAMPKKTEVIIWIYLSQIQERSYRDFLELDQVKQLLMGDKRRSPLMELVILKKLCDHPRLLSFDQCASLNLQMSETNVDPKMAQQLLPPAAQLIDESGKLLFLSFLMNSFLSEMASGKSHPPRTLIFSQSLKFLNMAEKIILKLNQRPENVSRSLMHRTLRLDGRITKVQDRFELIRLFEQDKSYTVMLLTTQVGGVGLTLTAANRVILLDPSWNPATDAQAVDRAYRIGQKSDVIVYRLITCATVEEKIYRRQIFKQSVIRQTTQTDVDPYRYFTRQDLLELFTLGDTRVSKTQQQLSVLHSDQHKWSDPTMRPHLEYLTGPENRNHLFGISFHDLMFSRSNAPETEQPTTVGEQDFLHNRRREAEFAIARECAVATGSVPHNLPSMRVPMRPLPVGDQLLIPTKDHIQRPMLNLPNLGRPIMPRPAIPDRFVDPRATTESVKQVLSNERLPIPTASIKQVLSNERLPIPTASIRQVLSNQRLPIPTEPILIDSQSEASSTDSDTLSDVCQSETDDVLLQSLRGMSIAPDITPPRRSHPEHTQLPESHKPNNDLSFMIGTPNHIRSIVAQAQSTPVFRLNSQKSQQSSSTGIKQVDNANRLSAPSKTHSFSSGEEKIIHKSKRASVESVKKLKEVDNSETDEHEEDASTDQEEDDDSIYDSQKSQQSSSIGSKQVDNVKRLSAPSKTHSLSSGEEKSIHESKRASVESVEKLNEVDNSETDEYEEDASTDQEEDDDSMDDMIPMDITMGIDDEQIARSIHMKSVHQILAKSGVVYSPSEANSSLNPMIVGDSIISSDQSQYESLRSIVMSSRIDESADQVEIIEDSILE